MSKNDQHPDTSTSPLAYAEDAEQLGLPAGVYGEDAKARGQPVGVYGESKYGACRSGTPAETPVLETADHTERVEA